MEHSLAIAILKNIEKDSKYFAGFVAGRNASPTCGNIANLANLLHQLGNAVTNNHQLDLLGGIRLDDPDDSHAPDLLDEDEDEEEDNASPLPMAECPQCHHQQPDGGHNIACRSCGAGPMPTAYAHDPAPMPKPSTCRHGNDPAECKIECDHCHHMCREHDSWNPGCNAPNCECEQNQATQDPAPEANTPVETETPAVEPETPPTQTQPTPDEPPPDTDTDPEPEQFMLGNGRILKVCGGLNAQQYFVGYSHSGAIERFKSVNLPVRPTRDEALADLRRYAVEKRLQPVALAASAT